MSTQIQIKPQDLRIGNILTNGSRLRDGCYIKVVEIRKDVIVCESEAEFHYRHLIPVSLTPEWLVRAGFECVLHNCRNRWIYFEMPVDWYRISIGYLEFNVVHNTVLNTFGRLVIHPEDSDYAFSDGLKINYLHELQNLYYVTMNEDLKILTQW